MTKRAIFYEPHCDDGVLSMGLAITNYYASGYDVILVSMNRGGNGGPLGSFNGDNVCNWSKHAYTHDPIREGYTPADLDADGNLTVEAIGLARIKESRTSLGAMSLIPMSKANGVPYPRGQLIHIDADLPNAFGSSGGASTLPPTPAGIAAARAVIEQMIQDYPGSLHFTMSPVDKHADHAACGQALRDLKNSTEYGGALANARFFVSKLYWDYTKYPEVKAQPDKKWYGEDSSAFLARKAEYDAHLRTRVIDAFGAWNPAASSYAIGMHQVAGQFQNCFYPTVGSISNLWHA